MHNTLYILTHKVQKEKGDFSTYLHLGDEKENERSHLVFIQNGLGQEDRLSKNMYAVQNDKKNENSQILMDSITYQDVLGLIFFSDSVIVI